MTVLLRIEDVAARLGVSRRTAFKLAKQPGFPAPLRLTRRLVRYADDELERWMQARLAERSQHAA